MQEELVTFEVAKLAKEKGFNLKTHDYFSKDKYRSEFNHHTGFDDDYWGDNYVYDWNTNGEPFKPFNKECYSRPTQSLLQKWLREVHNCIVEVLFVKQEDINKLEYYSTVDNYGIDFKNKQIAIDYESKLFDSYEEALEVGLYEGLKLIEDLK